MWIERNITRKTIQFCLKFGSVLFYLSIRYWCTYQKLRTTIWLYYKQLSFFRLMLPKRLLYYPLYLLLCVCTAWSLFISSNQTDGWNQIKYTEFQALEKCLHLKSSLIHWFPLIFIIKQIKISSHYSWRL